MNQAVSIKPPEALPLTIEAPSVFAAGTIEMGTSVDWQNELEEQLSDFNVLVFNPRREYWDSSWDQSIEHPEFRRQVEWELEALERADFIVMNLIPETLSPISLLELGMFADSGKLLVCCPEGFWRKGNVEVICNKFDIPLFSDFKDLVNTLTKRLEQI